MRRRQRALARAMLALFCLAWLQAAALPCVLAEAGMQGAAAPSHDCPYCPPADSSSPSCDDHGNCAYPHQPQVDARAAATLFVAIPTPHFLPLKAAAQHAVHTPEWARPEPVPRVPLSVSYCRFIE